LDSVSRIDNGAWRFVAGVYEGRDTNIARIYIDGVEDAAGKLGSVPDTGSGSSWKIGRFLGLGTPFRGSIGDLRIFNRALRPPEIQALYRCSGREADLTIPGRGTYYYLPIFISGVTVDLTASDAPGARLLRNPGADFSGVQFARSDGNCAVASLRGEDIGQDVDISVDVLTPTDSGRETLAGPYFRSRRADPGDGILGGTSAGYWVQLHSTGEVQVRCLNPSSVIAFSAPKGSFDSSAFHALRAVALGPELNVWLDGKQVGFDQGGKIVTSVAIPAMWEGPPGMGTNGGAAGIAFGCMRNRHEIGGQRAKNLKVNSVR